jgi:hypothetical protein
MGSGLRKREGASVVGSATISVVKTTNTAVGGNTCALLCFQTISALLCFATISVVGSATISALLCFSTTCAKTTTWSTSCTTALLVSLTALLPLPPLRPVQAELRLEPRRLVRAIRADVALLLRRYYGGGAVGM